MERVLSVLDEYGLLGDPEAVEFNRKVVNEILAAVQQPEEERCASCGMAGGNHAHECSKAMDDYLTELGFPAPQQPEREGKDTREWIIGRYPGDVPNAVVTGPLVVACEVVPRSRAEAVVRERDEVIQTLTTNEDTLTHQLAYDGNKIRALEARVVRVASERDQLRERANSHRLRVVVLSEALRELVRLKLMKGKPIEVTGVEYQAAKDAAWDAARAALDGGR
jgi:hypothetical protein